MFQKRLNFCSPRYISSKRIYVNVFISLLFTFCKFPEDNYYFYYQPIEIKLSGDYERSSSRYFTAEGSVDYSNDPEDKLIGKLSMEDISGITDLILLNIYHKGKSKLMFKNIENLYLVIFFNFQSIASKINPHHSRIVLVLKKFLLHPN